MLFPESGRDPNSGMQPELPKRISLYLVPIALYQFCRIRAFPHRPHNASLLPFNVYKQRIRILGPECKTLYIDARHWSLQSKPYRKLRWLCLPRHGIGCFFGHALLGYPLPMCPPSPSGPPPNLGTRGRPLFVVLYFEKLRCERALFTTLNAYFARLYFRSVCFYLVATFYTQEIRKNASEF